jgi:predicted dinucleotide-binding enzyme
MHRRTVIASIGATVALSTLAQAQTRTAGSKERIAILGTGSLGSTLAECWGRAGYPIVLGSRTPQDQRVTSLLAKLGSTVSAATLSEAARQASIVVFALPWPAVRTLMPSIGDLTGKIIIDPMNSMKWVGAYPHPPDIATSVSEELQSLAPGAKVVKALNTPTAANMRDPKRAGGHVSIPLAGDDVSAKAQVAALVTQMGLEPLDVGPLVAARYIEAMLRLSAGYVAYTRGKYFEYHLVPVKT